MSATITELDYALNCAAIEIDTTNAREEYNQLRARAAEAYRLQAVVDAQAEQLRQASVLIQNVWEMADCETSTVDIQPESLMWQIEADTRAWLNINAPKQEE